MGITTTHSLLTKTIQALGHRHSTCKVFNDFLEMAAIAISNNCDLKQFDTREARYMQIIKGYDKDELSKFSEMLGKLTVELAENPSDVLGRVFHELELHNKYAGQFFTPYDISRMMAKMTVDKDFTTKAIAERGFVTAMEPASGSGAMIIAFAQELKACGVDLETQAHVTTVDVDLKCVHMTYLQLSLLGVPATVVHGNSLSLETWSVWYTPAHILGGWSRKLNPPEQDATPAAEEIAA